MVYKQNTLQKFQESSEITNNGTIMLIIDTNNLQLLVNCCTVTYITSPNM